MTFKLKYSHKFLLALIGSSKELQKKTLSALYEMGTDGDYTDTENSKIDKLLQELMNEEEMPDSIGEIYDLLQKKIKRHLTK
jgi:hypothetical protein